MVSVKKPFIEIKAFKKILCVEIIQAYSRSKFQRKVIKWQIKTKSSHRPSAVFYPASMRVEIFFQIWKGEHHAEERIFDGGFWKSRFNVGERGVQVTFDEKSTIKSFSFKIPGNWKFSNCYCNILLTISGTGKDALPKRKWTSAMTSPAGFIQ